MILCKYEFDFFCESFHGAPSKICEILQMFGAMFGAAMFGDGDEEDLNDIFMGKACRLF